MKNQMVNREAMISRNDPRQGRLLDPWEHLGPKRRKLLQKSWAGLFRQKILAELPVDQIAPWFRADFGRPSKELYTASWGFWRFSRCTATPMPRRSINWPSISNGTMPSI